MKHLTHEWTDEQIRVLKERFPTDENLAQIACDVRHSRPECINMARKLGLKSPQKKKNTTLSPKKKIQNELKEIEKEISTPHISLGRLQDLVLRRSILSNKLDNMNKRTFDDEE